MKSNIEYLREDINKAEFLPSPFKDQLMEWIEAIEVEMKSTTVLDTEYKDIEIAELRQEIESIKEDWVDPDTLVTIDFGYGEVQYVQPDNLKLQCLMESFKEAHSVHAY